MNENMQNLHTSFLDNVQKVLAQENPNVSVTENGAIGYETTGKALLDLNFALSSMRNMSDNEIWAKFLKAFNEDPKLAIVWLFFARDARGGCGERRSFRVIFTRLAYERPNLAINLLPLIPEYGRWDDLIWIYDHGQSIPFKIEIEKMLKKQLDDDYDAYKIGKPITLLAKWMPSLNTSSKDSKRIANNLRLGFLWSPKMYRQRLSVLRKYLNVVERTISAGKWDEIDYEAVPSKAGMIYRGAFLRHDSERYAKYLEFVKEGKAKMNADVLFPYEIVHAYMDADGWSDETNPYDPTLELKWKNLPNSVTDDNGTLVVVDGSGSMGSKVGNTSVSCHDVARSLGIYFAERLTGAFKNAFITFSANPKLVKFNGVESLKSKLDILIDEDECSNTNIEKTFDLILKTVVENHMKQEEIPANILIVSDMEFDATTRSYDWHTGYSSTFDKSLFDEIGERWNAAGYKLPRLVFWNVCSRTGTIPVTENEMGVALVSGFSPMIADMVMSGELDPYKVLVNKLHDTRYEKVWKVVMPS